MSTPVTERHLLERVGRRYRRQGYRVTLEPRGDELPPFLAPFEPDIIAVNDRESVVVEVKRRRDLPASGEIVALADAVNGQEGWRFDLALVQPERSPLVAEGAQSLAQGEIVARLRTARQLAQQDQDDAALLLAWSAIEAALRLVAARQRITIEDEQAASMIKQLYTLGVIGRSDYDLLREGLARRDTVAHGFHSQGEARRLVEDLADLVEQLLQERRTERAM